MLLLGTLGRMCTHPALSCWIFGSCHVGKTENNNNSDAEMYCTLHQCTSGSFSPRIHWTIPSPLVEHLAWHWRLFHGSFFVVTDYWLVSYHQLTYMILTGALLLEVFWKSSSSFYLEYVTMYLSPAHLYVGVKNEAVQLCKPEACLAYGINGYYRTALCRWLSTYALFHCQRVCRRESVFFLLSLSNY